MTFEGTISMMAERMMPPLTHHGFDHVQRVAFYRKLISAEEGIECTQDLLAAFYCHDIGRVDDTKDDDHGQRGAERFMREVFPHFDFLDSWSIYFAIAYHQDYGRPLVYQHDVTGVNLLVPRVLWDADRLDLARLEKFRGRIGPAHLHTDFAKRFANTAVHLRMYDDF